MPTAPIDALIIGAGPVGLTLAAALHHQGLRCRIIDKAPAPSDKSKALVVWCRTLELLDQLDLADTFVHLGRKLTGGSIYAGGQRLVHLALTSDDSPYGFPLMIPQNETERLLTDHLANNNIHVERPVELLSFAEKENTVACTLRHADGSTESTETPWLIGCDGAHSTVRHTLGFPFTGHAEPNDWMLADVHIAGPLPEDEITVFWHEKGILALFPITTTRFRVIADIGPASEHAKPPDPTLSDVQARVDERGPGGLTVSDPVWLANFRINERKVADYRKGRVMLAGDAAHIHSPAGGQGMNTGMQDAFNLAWKLALVQRGIGRPEPLLQSYTIERSAVGDQVLRNAERFTTLATLRNPATQWLRNHLAPIVGSFQFVQDKIRNEWFELSINYRHSPLSLDAGPSHAHGPRAGDRLCDAPLTSATDGRTTSLLKLIRGKQHVLLLLPGNAASTETQTLLTVADEAARAYPNILEPHLITPAPPSITSPIPTWIDSTNRLEEKLHTNAPTMLLIRPDGYIALPAQRPSTAALQDHLDRYFLRKTA